MASHAADGSSAAQNHMNEIQSSVIKTMIFVSACYAISWLPAYIHAFAHYVLHPSHILFDRFYYGFSLLAYSYMCINPFIYATNLDPVRQVLGGLIPCRKCSVQAEANGARRMELAI